MKISILNFIIILILTVIFNGCATTSISYNEDTNNLILTNKGEKIKISDITQQKENHIRYVVQSSGNSRNIVYSSTKDFSCKFINIFELLPLRENTFYLSSVLDDMKDIYKGFKIEKYGDIYLTHNTNEAMLGFETFGPDGVNSKTYITISTKCLMKFTNQYKNNPKSIWYKPTEIIEN